MSNTEIISEVPIGMGDLRDTLKKIKKRDETLNFRAEKTEEYVDQFKLLPEKTVKEITKKLEDLDIPRLKPEHIIKLIDILPSTPDDVSLVLQSYTITVTKENLKRVADVLKEYSK